MTTIYFTAIQIGLNLAVYSFERVALTFVGLKLVRIIQKTSIIHLYTLAATVISGLFTRGKRDCS